MAGKKPPIVIKVTPTPKATGKGSPYQQFIAYWRKKTDGSYLTPATATAIYEAAMAEHVNPVAFAALILNESRGDFNVSDSKAGAIGIGQLMPSSFADGKMTLPWEASHVITEADLRDPGTNLRLAAWYMGQLVGKYPSDWYGRYNAGPKADPKVTQQIQNQFTKKWISPWNKNYVPTSPTSPPGKAGQQVPGGTAPPAQDFTFKDPYVAGISVGRTGSGMQGGPEGAPTQGGKFITTNDPNKALQYNGFPLTRSAFKSLTASLAPYYVSYTGRRPTPGQIASFVKNNWTTYTLEQLLSKSPHFQDSPIFKQQGTALQDAVKEILPTGGKVPKELMRQAILNNWDASTLASELRKQPTYLNSNEFKGNIATLLNVQTSIMGSADAQSMISIKDAALAGWNSDQYAAWLRSQPGYVNSEEYHSKAMTMLDALGALTGRQVTLKPGAGAGPGQVGQSAGALPQDKRVAGDPSASGGNNALGFAYSG